MRPADSTSWDPNLLSQRQPHRRAVSEAASLLGKVAETGHLATQSQVAQIHTSRIVTQECDGWNAYQHRMLSAWMAGTHWMTHCRGHNTIASSCLHQYVRQAPSPPWYSLCWIWMYIGVNVPMHTPNNRHRQDQWISYHHHNPHPMHHRSRAKPLANMHHEPYCVMLHNFTVGTSMLIDAGGVFVLGVTPVMMCHAQVNRGLFTHACCISPSIVN